MTGQKPASPKPPHLTPASLVGRRFGKDPFNGIQAALVGYCPRPDCLDAYHPRDLNEQYFIHVPPANTQICTFGDLRFLSAVHIYGGPVSSAFIEELGFYGIRTILAYGLAGGLGTKGLKMGDVYLVERALAMDGTTPHYTADPIISCSPYLQQKILQRTKDFTFPKITPVQALTSDAIYREFDQDLEDAKGKGCDIVNCDSSHLYAVSREMGIQSVEYGVLSDVAQNTGGEWESILSGMLSENRGNERDPLQLVGKIVRFYVEDLLPELIGVI